ncbi:hypothetical protein BS47DRAFT_1347220, partial [Hydnum rufescens UP504]
MHSFVALIAASLPLFASAITITQPTSAGWVGNSSVTVAWTWTVQDLPFTVELGNPQIQSGLLAQGPIAVLNNISPNQGSANFELPVLPPGTDYFIQFVNPNDINTVYASISPFPIISNPTSSSVSLPSTAGVSTTTRSSTIRTSSVRNSTSTTSSSTTTTTTTQPITTLVISSLNPTSSSTTTSATRQSSALPITTVGWNNVASAFVIGAVVLGAY